MTSFYLVMEKGLLEETTFSLDDRMTIGRDEENDIHLTDLAVSRQHARVQLLDGQVIVEDLGSINGTCVNGEKVVKAQVRSGDMLRFGSVNFRLIQRQEPKLHVSSAQTQELSRSGIFEELLFTDLSGRSRRLTEAVTKMPLFAPLSDEVLDRLNKVVQIVIYDQGRYIFKQGDRGRSLYIILDGRVRVVTYDNQGKEVTIAVLKENQFFGEMSLLTGAPRTATVQALEETLLGRFSFEAMREIVQSSPAMKGILEEYYNTRLKELEKKRNDANIKERRRHPRYNVQVPVSFSVSPTASGSDNLRNKQFQSLSKDISISGVRIEVRDRLVLELSTGCQLRLEISLPQPWGSIRCLGALRNVVEGKDGQDLVYLGVEFTEMPSEAEKKLSQFLAG